jgi:hypothetical protein
LHSVIPAHGKAPSRVNESSRVDREGTWRISGGS